MNKFFAFQWHILDDCDQRCNHCYIFQQEKELHTMNYEEMEIVLDNCLDMCNKTNRIPYFSITGGDPILHPNFWELLEKFNDLNINFSLMGNPFHLTDEVCIKLHNLGCRQYQMSIDGLRKTHDWFRKPGSFDLTFKKIRALKNAGIKSSIMTTVSKKNISQIPWIIDEVVRNKVDGFSFARYCPNGGDIKDLIAPMEYKNLLEKVWVKFNDYKFTKTIFTLKDHLWTLFLHEKGLFEIPQNLRKNVIYGGCNCGNSHLTILPTGDVYACRRMESKVGNALTDDIYDVFVNNLDEYRKFEQFEKCSKCELLRFCRGCPAVSYAYNGDMYSPDPQCWKAIY